MADLITRPESRPDVPAVLDTITPREDSLSERLITTQSPQRPQSTPRIRIEVDGHVVEGFEGQTILEVCRDNGIEIPTLCYEPRLPATAACRMCIVEVEGARKMIPSCSAAVSDGMVVKTSTEKVRAMRHLYLELLLSDHNSFCTPPCRDACPTHIKIPQFLDYIAERPRMRAGFGRVLGAAIRAVNNTKPSLGSEDRRELVAFYAAECEKLELLLGRSLAAWRRV